MAMIFQVWKVGHLPLLRIWTYFIFLVNNSLNVIVKILQKRNLISDISYGFSLRVVYIFSVFKEKLHVQTLGHFTYR